MRWAVGMVVIAALAVGLAYWLIPRGGVGPEVCTRDEAEIGPSGRVLKLCEILVETQPSGVNWTVVRAVDPDLPPASTDSEPVDHDWICATWGVPEMASESARIVVQIMAEPFVRGEATPGISQSIEVFSVEGGTCIWELL